MSKGRYAQSSYVNIKNFSPTTPEKLLWRYRRISSPTIDAMPNYDVHIYQNLTVDGNISLKYANTGTSILQPIQPIYLDALSELNVVQYTSPTGEERFKIFGETSIIPGLGPVNYEPDQLIALLIRKIQLMEEKIQSLL